MKWIVRLEITTSLSQEPGISQINPDNTETFYKHGSILKLPKAIKHYHGKYPDMKYKIIFFPRLHCFFTFFGKQNDYLFPSKDEEHAERYPFKKPHLWKTRFGFKTAWFLSK